MGRKETQNRIEHARRAAKLDRTQLGAQLGVSERTVYRWERGETQVPDEHKLAMAELFGLSVPWLMGWVRLDGNNDNNDDHATEAA